MTKQEAIQQLKLFGDSVFEIKVLNDTPDCESCNCKTSHDIASTMPRPVTLVNKDGLRCYVCSPCGWLMMKTREWKTL